MTDFTTPSIPIDTRFNPTNGKIKTKNVYYSKGNDLDNDGSYVDENEINLFLGKNKMVNTNFSFLVDNHSNPKELTIINSNFKIKLVNKDEYDDNSFYLPLMTAGVDSVIIYNTEYDFNVEFEYVGHYIETVHIFFNKKNTKNLIESKKWFNSLTPNEKLTFGNNLTDNQILNNWIEVKFLVGILNENFTDNQKFSLKYTNLFHYTNDEDYLNHIDGDKSE